MKPLRVPDPLRPLLGPLVALAAIGAVEALAWTPYRVPNAPAIVLLALVFSAFVSGLWPGLLTAALAWGYFAYFFSIHGQSGRLFVYSTDDFRRVVIWAFAVPTMALMVGALHRRATRQVAQKLDESEKMLQTLIDQSPVAVQVLAPDGTTLRVNDAWERLWGTSREVLASYNILKDEQLVKRGVMPYLLKGFAGETSHMPPVFYDPAENGFRGEARWTESVIYPVTGEDRKVRQVVILHQDVTERVKAVEALKESEERKRAILESALDCMVTMDHRGNIVEFNPAAERTFGYAKADVVGKPMADLIIPPSLRENHRQGLARHLATGEGPVLGQRIEMPAMRADGVEFPVELSIIRATQEGPPLFTGFIRDITERKRAEEALLKSERQLSLIYSNVSDVLYYLAVEPDDRFRFLAVNPPLLKATGLTESQVVGKLVQEVIPEPSLALVLGKYKEAIRDRKTVKWEEVSVYPAGTKHGEVSVTPIFDANGHCTNLVGTVHDITERKQAEEALRRAESLATVGRLSSQVAHEINNPLTSLLGYLERVKARAAGDPKSAEAAERIERAAFRIRDLAKDLLSLARTSRMEMGPVRLPALLADGRKMLEPDFEKHGVRVEWKVPDSLPEIRGSGEHLHQAFSNMLINARQAMPSGGVLTVEAAPADGGVRVSVADTGVGIPRENLERIFEPFFTTKPKGEGTGLGLAICQSVVSQHGGRIEVRSEAGKGSTFTVVLPAGRDEGHRQASPVSLPANGPRGGAP